MTRSGEGREGAWGAWPRAAAPRTFDQKKRAGPVQFNNNRKYTLYDDGWIDVFVANDTERR